MRRLGPLLAVLAAVAPSGGCFVLDELDKGQAIMDQHAPKKPEKAETAPAAGSEGTGPDAQAAARAWWAEARTLSRAPRAAGDPGDPNAVVRCTLRGAASFMRRGDCLSQGGRPGS